MKIFGKLFKALNLNAVRDRIYLQNILVCIRIWRNKFPKHDPKPRTCLEKIVLSMLLSIRALSASNLIALFAKSNVMRYNFIDIYVITNTIIITVLLNICELNAYVKIVAIIIAIYRIVDIISYQLCILLIDHQKRDWKLASINRSYISAFFNLYELIACFGIIFLTLGDVYISNDVLQPFTGCMVSSKEPLTGAMNAFYYSFVTMATLGYGEYLPESNSRIIVIMELAVSIIYLFTVIPIFVSSLSGKIAAREYRDLNKKV